MNNQLEEDLFKLFQYDNHEEICYPIVRIYFLYRTGRKLLEGKYEYDTLLDAFQILGIDEEVDMSKFEKKI